MSPRSAAAPAEDLLDEPTDHIAYFRGKLWRGPGDEPLPFPPPKAKGKLWEMKDGALVSRMHWGQSHAYTSQAKVVAIVAGSQGGKALALDTPIPTPSGWKTMGALRVGDEVFDATGAVCRVTYLSPIYLGNDCFRLTFDDGVSVVADAEHLWATQTYKERKNKIRRVAEPTTRRAAWQRLPTSGVRTTREIAATLVDEHGGANHSVPLCPGPQWAFAALPIPPYTLGAWLGDGTSSSAELTSADSEVLEAIREEGVAVGSAKEVHAGQARGYRLGGNPGRGGDPSLRANTMQAQLRTLGLLGNKHIPSSYLLAARSQRLALLQGLMDTDGNIVFKGRGASCEYTTISERLASEVATLARSLGIKVRVSTRIPKINGRPSRMAYRVKFTTAHKVFRLVRKVQRIPKSVRPDVLNRYVVACEPVPTVPVRCITVDAPSSTYLCTTAFVPTHNTSFGPLWLEQEIARRGPGDYLVVTPTVPLSRLKAIPEFLKLFEQALKLGRWLKGDRVFLIHPDRAARYFNNPEFNAPGAEPTRIIFGTAQNPESLESATAKGAWLDEAGQRQFRLESWEAVQRRLTINQGRTLITSTPYNLGWLYQKIFKPWKDKTSNSIDVIQFPSNTNPAFPDAGMVDARESLPYWRYMLFFEGQFEKPSGLIYNMFEDAHWRFGGHLVRDFPIPLGWPRWVGLDFGGANMATVWIAQDPETRDYYLYHETLSGSKTTHQHAQEAREFAGDALVLGWFGGAAAEAQQRRDWAQAGIPVQGPPTVRDEWGKEVVLTDVELGINRVISMFQRTAGRLYVFESCGGTRAQLGAYSRLLLPDGTPTEKIEDKSKYHYLDALRYVGQHISGDALFLPDILALGATAGGWSNPLAFREGNLPVNSEQFVLPLPLFARGDGPLMLPSGRDDSMRPRIA